MANAWGNSWGGDSGAWGVSWGGTPAPITVIDTHDGERKHKRFEEQRQARSRLREQIRQAIDGPDSSLLAPALERVARAGPEPIEERIDFAELLAQVELWKAVRKAADEYVARERAIDNDDEEILLLL